MTAALCSVVALAAALPLLGQTPAADWRTVTTRHFRVHYTQDASAWAQRAASRLEAVRDAVVKEVGFGPETVTDVLVMNPIADANGITLPLLDAPRIVYYTEPPDPESTIGEYSDWIDLLTVHETTHLVHLMRSSRNAQQRLLEHLLPLNPITLDAPRWVLEGYATVVEGRITGSGRPHSALRAAVLRKWAIEGRLPTYGELNSGREFLGMSMAYLAGSAYLEWLERRSGPDSLRHLWARMTARQRRSFDAAFNGVFGEPPSRLYGQFVAELTSSAMAIAKSGPFPDGELWQETAYESGDPAVSPDGTKLAMVLRSREGKAKLVVYSTGTNEEEEKLAKRIEKILKRDPEDVAPVRTKPLPRKPLFTLELPDGGDIATPRWLPMTPKVSLLARPAVDGLGAEALPTYAAGRAGLLYTHRQPDREGVLHHDLFRWTPATGKVERVTYLADVHDAEPLDGTHAVAVRNRGGASQLVNVNLSNGDVTERTPASLEIVYARPRVAPDGRLAWSQHDHGGWYVVVDGRDGGSRGTFDPEWASDGTLYMVRAENGFLDIVTRDGGVVAHASGALEEPAAAPDGSLYFMSLEPGGFVVRHLLKGEGANGKGEGAKGEGRRAERADARQATVEVQSAEVKNAEVKDVDSADAVLRPAPIDPSPFNPAPGPVSAPRAYGIGRQEISPVVAGNYAQDFRDTEFGVRIGDVVGRLDTLILGAVGDVRGAAVATRWRGWPVNVSLHAFSTKGDHGAELRGSYTAHFPQRVFRIDGGALGGTQSMAFADGSLRLTQRATYSEDLRIGADSRHHVRGTLRIGNRVAALTFTAAQRDIVLGGLPSSLVPDSRNIARIFDPALTPLTVRDYRGARAEVTSGWITYFLQEHRFSGRTLRVAGASATLRSDIQPLVQLAAFDLTAGVARVIDEHRTRVWVGLRWRP